MKVQIKIIFLMLAIIIVFFGILFFQKSFERNRLILLFKQEEEHINTVFDKIIDLKGASLNTLAFDYTYWDEMVNLVEKEDRKWGKENLDPSLSTYNASAIWVYKLDLSQIYFVSNIEGAASLESLIPKVRITKMFSDTHFVHFYIYSDKGLFEVRGATVQPSSDNERKTPARGYFFAGRLWSKEYLSELSRLNGCNIIVNPVSEKENAAYSSNPQKGIISLTRILNNWKGRPAARIIVWKESEMIKDFNRSYNLFLLTLVSLVGLFLLVILYLLSSWIRKPLKSISEALETENSGYLDRLLEEKTEFGEISRIIAGFFDQKEELLVEIERRQEAEGDLKKLNVNLESRIKERTKALEEANKDLKDAYNELRETHNALIQSEKMAAVGLMASGIAHEIKNPIAIIIQGAEYLKSHPSCVSLGEEIEMVKKAALRADKIIKDLLDFSRQTPLTFEAIDCVTLIEESLSLVEHQMRLGNINIVREFAPDLPKLRVDANQMKQVFINILVNAVDAMPQGGQVTVSLDKTMISGERDYLQIVFTDTGSGIPEENIKKVFDPFFSTKKKSGSAGLGLAIIQKIIERHKGFIGIKSKVGVGTSMIITLPLT